MEYTIRDTFDVSADRFWEVFFSDAYNAGLWPAIDVDWKPLKFERTGEGSATKIIREQQLTPHRQAPKVIQKMVKGSTVHYVEKNDFDASTNSMKIVTVPNFMADRIDNHGTFRLEVLGDNQIARIWEGVCAAKVPLVGGQVEKYIVSEVKESYRKATEYTRNYLAKL
ncbi:MAG: DUF2505 family protein [Myxococcota bacterium]